MPAYIEDDPRHSGLVGNRSDRSDDGSRDQQRSPQRVSDSVKSTSHAHHGAWFEQAELERIEVEALLRLGIRGEHDLEAAIEQESVDRVAADAATHAIGSLEHPAVDTCASEILRAHEAGETRAHDDDVAAAAAVPYCHASRLRSGRQYPDSFQSCLATSLNTLSKESVSSFLMGAVVFASVASFNPSQSHSWPM